MASLPSAGLLVLVVGCAVLIASLTRWMSPRHPPLPPGPAGEWLLGHLRVIPKENTAQAYADWGRKYNSDVIYVKSLGQSIIVLNSVQAARDLLDRKGTNYSDRPRFILFEVMGWHRTLTFLPYGDLWKMHRKVLQSILSNSNINKWQPFQTQEARRTAQDILREPETWETSLRRFTAAVVLKVSYGVDVTDNNDPYIKIADDAMYATGNGGAPANSIVDVIPIARFFPDWVVRDWPLRFAREWKWAIQKLHEVPFAHAQLNKAIGATNESLASHLLDLETSLGQDALPTQEWSLEDIKGATGAVFIAGADTTWATLVIFILNMVLHPEIQTKAQTLLDSAVSPGRMPCFADRANVPYIDCIIQEVYRWSPLAPLGIPHKSMEADIYNGMFIPKGFVKPNIG